MLRPEKPKAATKPKPVKPAAKSPSYWSRIAGALGLEGPSEPEPVRDEVVQEEIAKTVDEPVAPRDESSSRRTDESRSSRGRGEYGATEGRRPTRQGREEKSPRGFDRPPSDEARGDRPAKERDEPIAPSHSLTEMFGKKPADLDVFGLGPEDEDQELPKQRLADEPVLRNDENGAVLDYDLPADSDLSFGEQPAAARELREEDREERDGGRRRRRRRGRGRRGGSTDERRETPPRHESDIEPAGEDADFDFDRDEELDLDVEAGDQGPSGRERPERGHERMRDSETDEFAPRGERQKRRGDGPRNDGRRGGRSRVGGEDGPRSDRQSASSRGERREETRPHRDQRPPVGHAAHSADEEIDEDLQAAAIDDDENGEGGAPTHKKIPTWEEAVNLLIDANMATRASNPDRGDRGRGRGRGRGR